MWPFSPKDHDHELESTLHWGSHTFRFSRQNGFWEDLNFFFYSSLCKNLARPAPIVTLPLLLGIIIWIYTIWECLNTRFSRSNSLSAKDVLKLPKSFQLFFIISLWERTWPFVKTKLKPLYQMMIYAKFGWICPVILEKSIM